MTTKQKRELCKVTVAANYNIDKLKEQYLCSDCWIGAEKHPALIIGIEPGPVFSCLDAVEHKMVQVKEFFV